MYSRPHDQDSGENVTMSFGEGFRIAERIAILRDFENEKADPSFRLGEQIAPSRWTAASDSGLKLQV